MNAFWNKLVSFGLLALAAKQHCLAQSNVYSLSVYSGGTSYTGLCSFAFPFSTNKFRVTVVSWLEDVNGLTVIDLGRKRKATDVPRRFLEVECSAECFWFDLDFTPSRGASVTIGCTKVIATRSRGDLLQTLGNASPIEEVSSPLVCHPFLDQNGFACHARRSTSSYWRVIVLRRSRDFWNRFWAHQTRASIPAAQSGMAVQSPTLQIKLARC